MTIPPLSYSRAPQHREFAGDRRLNRPADGTSILQMHRVQRPPCGGATPPGSPQKTPDSQGLSLKREKKCPASPWNNPDILCCRPGWHGTLCCRPLGKAPGGGPPHNSAPHPNHCQRPSARHFRHSSFPPSILIHGTSLHHPYVWILASRFFRRDMAAKA